MRRYVADVADEDSAGLGIVNVAHGEAVAEIAEDASGQTERVRADETDVVLVADRVQRLLILVHQVRDDHHLRFIAPSETNAEGLHILLS